MNPMELYFLLFLIACINILFAVLQIRSFLLRTPSIKSGKDFEAFKRMVRRQMYMALAQIGFLIVFMIVGIYGILTGRMGLLIVLALNGALIGFSFITKKLETRARTLTIHDEGLTEQYREVCQTWIQKPLPDF